jgi:hypothetical protein
MAISTRCSTVGEYPFVAAMALCATPRLKKAGQRQAAVDLMVKSRQLLLKNWLT